MVSSSVITPPALRVQSNNPKEAGKGASDKHLFGDCGRYAVQAIHTRFDSVCWFVFDAERLDELTNRASVIRQCATIEEAMEGLG